MTTGNDRRYVRERSRTDRVAAWVVNITLTLAFLLMLGFAVTVLYPWDPITKLAIRVPQSAVVGDVIGVDIDYCKARAWVPTVVRWSLINEITVVLGDTVMSMPTGCGVRRLLIPVSAHVRPGAYRLQEELIYEPWPWRRFTYVAQSETFTVLPAVAR